MREIIIDVPDGFGKTLKPEKVNSEIKGELVRCKDCKWHDNPDKSTKWLPCMEIRTLSNWFCADGEQK